ncbi:MAG: PhzF family phenazine biosynthesis isomerase [Nitriliruptorales bacterium]|nr:PhzF family phenazine biosynthesis isomerase [Nitriliruptorales bacterium]
MAIEFWLVDAFTSQPFAGNPAAVVIVDTLEDEAWMQGVAAEFNLSETAFVGPVKRGRRRLRWFTPTTEVDLCGHATLAASKVLLDSAAKAVVFTTRGGELRCFAHADGDIVMDFPSDPSDQPADSDAVAEVLGTPVLRAGAGRHYVVAELAGADHVATATPDLAGVAQLGRGGLVITAAGDDGADVVCRMFAPQEGIDEDPVTGSAWCALAPWWAPRVGDQFSAAQRSPRGGRLEVTLRGDRVELGGAATIVASGRLRIEPSAGRTSPREA